MDFFFDLILRAFQSAVASLGTTVFGIAFGLAIASLATILRLGKHGSWKTAMKQHWQENLRHFVVVTIMAWVLLLAYQFWRVTDDIQKMAARIPPPAPIPITASPPVMRLSPATSAKVASYVFVFPAVWLGTDREFPKTGMWDFMINHRGPDPCINTEIFFVDMVKQKLVTGAKSYLTLEDINSYQLILRFPEVDAHGHGSVFAQQFQWKPVDPDHEHYDVVASWRDGSVGEDLAIERLNGKWFWAMRVRDRDDGKILVDCKDRGFSFGDPKPHECFPAIRRID